MVYLTLLVGGFVKILGVDNTFTWDHFTFVHSLGADAIGTTLTLTLIAAPLAALLALAIGWLVVRHLPGSDVCLICGECWVLQFLERFWVWDSLWLIPRAQSCLTMRYCHH